MFGEASQKLASEAVSNIFSFFNLLFTDSKKFNNFCFILGIKSAITLISFLSCIQQKEGSSFCFGSVNLTTFRCHFTLYIYTEFVGFLLGNFPFAKSEEVFFLFVLFLYLVFVFQILCVGYAKCNLI